MFAKVLKTALVSGVLIATAAPSFAMGGGGEGGDWARVTNPDGSTVTARRNKDGSNTVTERDARGKEVKKRRVRRSNVPWASSYNPETGERVTAIGNGDGTRTVIRMGVGAGPFGISIGISR